MAKSKQLPGQLDLFDEIGIAPQNDSRRKKMKVREVISKCEELLDVSYTKEDLLNCFNIVENELALDYLPLYATHPCESKVVYYSEFQYNPVRIVGCNCAFKVYPTHIEAKETITSIQYAYTPNKKTLYDECSYSKEFLDCLVYGIISEYFVSQGFYEEAILWSDKYKQEIKFLRI